VSEPPHLSTKGFIFFFLSIQVDGPGAGGVWNQIGDLLVSSEFISHGTALNSNVFTHNFASKVHHWTVLPVALFLKRCIAILQWVTAHSKWGRWFCKSYLK
jgi:hypothetical protein